MSEALSSTEIEDVLSSIRRLVSEDLRPDNRAVAQPKGLARPSAAGPVVLTGDKLILTPAFRVVAETAGPAPDTAVFVRSLRPDRPVETAGIERVVASLGAAVGPHSTEWEAETGDTSPEFDEHPTEDDWALPEPERADDTDLSIEMDLSDDLDLTDDLVPPQNFVFASVRDLGEVIVAPEPTPDVIPGWAQQEDPGTSDDDPAETTAAFGTIEPDLAWADAAEASVIASLESDPTEDDADLQPEDEAMLFNEEVLRELVRDILREELAGKMGERITRNIRKLVRAEIARTLATQEFD